MPKRGFTLIELLVTISILAIISSIGFASYINAQLYARDARRKNDLRSIQTALELYHQKNRAYPTPATAGGWWLSNESQPWIQNLTTDYINQVPTDPQKNDGNPALDSTKRGYSYRTTPLAGSTCPGDTNGNQYFMLVAGLENANDADANGITPKYQYCDKTTNVGPANAFVITSE